MLDGRLGGQLQHAFEVVHQSGVGAGRLRAVDGEEPAQPVADVETGHQQQLDDAQAELAHCGAVSGPR